MNMAEYGSRRSEQPQNVNFEPIIRFNCKRKKWGKKISVNLQWTQMNLEELSQKYEETNWASSSFPRPRRDLMEAWSCLLLKIQYIDEAMKQWIHQF